MRRLAVVIVTMLCAIDVHGASRRHIVGRGGADPAFGVFVNVAARPDANAIGRALDLAQADGVGWIRMQFTWSVIQPSSSRVEFGLFDPIVTRATTDNFRIIGILGYATPWNTTAPATEMRSAQREHYPPADYDAWSRFVFTTVRQYRTSVHYWEIWNEPDNGSTPDASHTCNGLWCGTAAQYAQLLSTAYKAVKSADPSAVVLLGSLALAGPEVNTNFLLDVLTDPANPGVDNFDIMGFHIYGSTAEALRRMNFVKSQLAFGGASKPIWVTEYGYPSDTARQSVPPYNTGEAGQAAYIKDFTPYLFTLGARKVFWVQLFDTDATDPFGSYGLLTATFAKKQSYTAYGDVIKSLHP